MPKKYTQEFKNNVVVFYRCGHTITETVAHFQISESCLFDWKRQSEQKHQLPVETVPSLKQNRQAVIHAVKNEKVLNVMRISAKSDISTVEKKIIFIKKFSDRYSVRILCEAINLPRGTYYNRIRRENSKTQHDITDEAIKPLIQKVFMDSKKRFGRKPIHQKLSEQGIQTSEKRIARLMKDMGLHVERPQYLAEHKKPLPQSYFVDKLKREFTQVAPNLVWGSDITYIKVADSYCYICVILDLFSRRVLAYKISENIDTLLSISTFDAAFSARNKPVNLLFHSDQGAQYTAYPFRCHLRRLSVKQSFSHSGSPLDNSVCESFFRTLKKEALYHHLYSATDELQAVMDEYIQFYNNERPHRHINMKTPVQYESEFYETLDI